MTREEQERVARGILGWNLSGDLIIDMGDAIIGRRPDADEAAWLWPLRIALEERGWGFAVHDGANGQNEYEAYRSEDVCLAFNNPAEAVNSAALVELEGKE